MGERGQGAARRTGGGGGARTLIRGGELSRGWVRESGLGEILRGLGAMARANARARSRVCVYVVCVDERVYYVRRLCGAYAREEV